MKYLATNQKIEVENYPYGFTLRTSLFDTMEFNPKKGYRHVTQTINPKTGKLNKPKKSTYSELLVRFFNEDGHIKVNSFSFNGDEQINRGCKFVHENFDLFTDDEKKYINNVISTSLIINWKASVIWGKTAPESAKEVYIPLIDLVKDNKDLENIYDKIFVDDNKLIKIN